MSENTTYRIFAVSETLSQLTHSSGTSGNEALVMRGPVRYDGRTEYVPVISGNAIRHRCIRESGFRYLIDLYGLRRMLSKEQANLLLHGGNLTQGDGRDNMKVTAEMRRVSPLAAVLGGALPSQIVGGNLLVGIGWLACREYQAVAEKLYAAAKISRGGDWHPAESFVHHYQYTRGDAVKTHDDLIRLPPENEEDRKSNLMIFSGQAVVPGASFLHEFILTNASTLELGALLHSLEMWQCNGGTIGGKAAIGHGKLDTRLVVCDTKGGELTVINDRAPDYTMAYLQHAKAVESDFKRWLDDVFRKSEEVATKKAEKAAAKKKPAKAKAAVADESAPLFGDDE